MSKGTVFGRALTLALDGFNVGYFFLRFLCGTGTLAGAFVLAEC
jgi:hypothetical protein